MAQMIKTVITDKNQAWDAYTFEEKHFTFHLRKETLAQLYKEREHLRNHMNEDGSYGVDTAKFPLLIEDIKEFKDSSLENGPGFGVIVGLNPVAFSEIEMRNIYWIVMITLGTPLGQDKKGFKSREVKDRQIGGMAGGGRYSAGKEGGSLHTDSPQYVTPPDYLGLLCLHPGMVGGRSLLVSATTIHNHLLENNPDLLEVLYEDFPFDKRGDHKPEDAPYTEAPVFKVEDGKLKFRYLDTYMEGAEKHGAKLTEKQKEAMQAVNALLNDKKMQATMMLQAGHIQFLVNERMAHGRTGFENYLVPGTDEVDQRIARVLVRAWLRR